MNSSGIFPKIVKVRLFLWNCFEQKDRILVSTFLVLMRNTFYIQPKIHRMILNIKYLKQQDLIIRINYQITSGFNKRHVGFGQLNAGHK